MGRCLESLRKEKREVGVAFRPKDPGIVEVAVVVVYGDFFELVDKLKLFLDRFQ